MIIAGYSHHKIMESRHWIDFYLDKNTIIGQSFGDTVADVCRCVVNALKNKDENAVKKIFEETRFPCGVIDKAENSLGVQSFAETLMTQVVLNLLISGHDGLSTFDKITKDKGLPFFLKADKSITDNNIKIKIISTALRSEKSWKWFKAHTDDFKEVGVGLTWDNLADVLLSMQHNGYSQSKTATMRLL